MDFKLLHFYCIFSTTGLSGALSIDELKVRSNIRHTELYSALSETTESEISLSVSQTLLSAFTVTLNLFVTRHTLSTLEATIFTFPLTPNFVCNTPNKTDGAKTEVTGATLIPNFVSYQSLIFFFFIDD